MPSRRGRVEDQDYVARNLSLHNNANIYVFEDITARSLPDEKILTRGKWGTTCCRARGRPSNASSDPVPEKHASHSSIGGAPTSHVTTCVALRFFRPGLAAISGLRIMTWWGVDISNLAYIFRRQDASLSEIFPLARRECHGGRLPKAEQEVFYSEIECSLIWVGNHHKPHMARCEAPHFMVQDRPAWIPCRRNDITPPCWSSCKRAPRPRPIRFSERNTSSLFLPPNQVVATLS